ncbi:MAG: hypothetical protein ACXU86_20085, partial [Archangium sp.]
MSKRSKRRRTGGEGLSAERLRAAQVAVDADLALALAEAALDNRYPVTSLQSFQRFLKRWPEHPHAAEARQKLEQLESVLPEVLSSLGLVGEDAVPLALEHERIQH